VTFVNFSQNDSQVSLNDGSGLVIIDSRTSIKATPTIKINANTNFNGIIWIIGNAVINGGANIHGTIFVDGAATFVSGNSGILYDSAAIDAALINLGPSFSNKAPYLVDWKEL